MTLLGAVALTLVVGVGAEGLTVSETEVARGETITVSGAGCGPDSEVNLFLDGSTFAKTRTDPTGAFVAPVTIADDVGTGSHGVTAIGSGCGATAQVVVERVDEGDDSDRSEVLAALALLLVAIAVAVTIVVAARRRWPDDTDSQAGSETAVPPPAATATDAAARR